MAEMNFDMGESMDEAIKAEFDHSGIDRLSLREDMSMLEPLIGPEDSQMLEHDIGRGLRLGDSVSVVKALQEGARQVRSLFEKRYGGSKMYPNGMPPSQVYDEQFRGDARGIIGRALLNGRSEFIKKTGMTLPGY